MERCGKTIYFPDIDEGFGGRFTCELTKGHIGDHEQTQQTYDDSFVDPHDRIPHEEADHGKDRKVASFLVQWDNAEDQAAQGI